MKRWLSIIPWLLALALASQISVAEPKMTFRDSYVRYVSGHDLFRLLQQKFPDAQWNNFPDCTVVNEANRTAIGFTNPADGQQTYPAPSTAFAKWYLKCVSQAIDSDLQNALSKTNGLNRFFGDAALNLLPKNSDPAKLNWNDMSVEAQNAVALNLLYFYIGPQIILGENAWVNKLNSAVPATAKATDAIKQLIALITSQDEFLTY